MPKAWRPAALALAALLAAGPALAETAQRAQAAPGPAAEDPLESLNRGFFIVGGAIDMALLRPVAVFYGRVTPKPVREGVVNVISNLGEPANAVNRTLQLRPAAAARAVGRLALNTTAGVGGVFDVASAAGLPRSPTSFGQTLARYGTPRGPYLFVPVLGPTTLRDGLGRIADIFLDPVDYVRFHGDTWFFAARTVAPGLEDRYDADPALRELQRTATDPYAAIRAAYLQNAAFQENGGQVDVQALPDFGTPTPAAPPSAASPPSPK